MDADEILSLNLAQLKQKLTELGLATTGRKTVLQDKLLEYYSIDTEEIEQAQEEVLEFSDAREDSRETTKFTLKDVRETISVFYGTNQQDIEQWLQEFEDVATVVIWNDLQKFIYAKQLIKGAAQLWLRGQANIRSWVKLKSSLQQEFGSKLSTAAIHKSLANTKKTPKETYLEFLYKIVEKAKPLRLDDESIIEYFVEGILDSRSNKTVLYEAKSMDELKEKIRVYEKIKTKNFRPAGFKDSDFKWQNWNNSGKKCEFCPHLSNHSTEECRKANNLCFNCNRKGHKAADCNQNREQQKENGLNHGEQRNYRQTNTQMNNNRRSNTQNSNNRLNNNSSSNSNNRQNNNNNTYSNHPNVQNVVDSNVRSNFCFTPINIQKKVTINNRSFTALFDTGSELTLLTKSIFDTLEGEILFPSQIKICGVGQGELKTLGYIITRACIDDIEFNGCFHIVNDKDIRSQPLLGSDILKIFDVTITKSGASFWLKEKQQPLEDVLFDEMLGSSQKSPDKDFIVGHEFRALCEDNSTDVDIELGSNTSQLTPSMKIELTNLIRNYRPNKTESTNVETKIILTNDIPIRQKPRRLSYQDQKFVEKQISEWLRDGIIRPSQSEYASPIVLVSKKDGTKRLCCDYRKLNENTVRDNYPMIMIDDVLSRLQSATIFTTIDLKNGYFHVPMEENSRKYTAFVTHHGQYEFLKTPFGITNAPAIFCRYIAAVFHEFIQNGTIIVYMDDIVIPSHTVNENFEKLSQILQHASKHGLQINFKKCQFIQVEISFLGYVIKNSTIKPSNEKVKAVTNFREPTDTKTLQRFLGLTSYFRRFIKNYSFIAKPLTNLLTKNSKFRLNDEERLAIQQLKHALTNSPILKIFNPHAATEVHTDASMYGYGAALLQKDAEDLKWHPVEYMSRKTTQCEQKYHSYELEVLAIISALKKWKCYLMGIHIKIVTDCHAFTQTVKKKEVPARIARWIMLLQEFDYEVEHRAGSRLRHVDALSRVHSFIIQSSLKHSIIEAQKKDEWISAIRQILTNQNYQDFYLKYDIVYKDPNKELIVIPVEMEKEIIELAHRQGHVSIKKTIDIVQKEFYIKNITDKVAKIVKNCIYCIISDAKAGKKEGMLNPIDKSDRPLETFHIDHVGPLENTHKQYNHILAIVDAFSKFIWLYPTKSTGTNEVVNILRKQSSIFGNPSRIVTDRGTAFTSQLFQEYCEEQNITHHLITTGVPRGNGQIERMHKIVISLLTKMCAENPQNWYKHIDKIQQTLNNTTNRSTKTTPFQILTGIKMKTTGLDEIKELLTEEEIKELEENREEIRENARKNIIKIQEENSKTYNKNRKVEKEYQIGDLVAIKRTQFGTGLKIKPQYLGPYTVTKKKRLGRYEVEKLGENEGPKRTSTVAEHMKPWSTHSGRIRCQDDRM